MEIFDATSGRYQIKLLSDEKAELKAIKEDNLREVNCVGC